MTIQTRIKLVQLATLLVGGSLLTPVFAYAAGVNVTTEAKTAVTAGAVSASSTASVKVDAKLQPAIDKADKEIDRRIASLNELTTRIDATQRVTAEFKQKLTTNVQNHITGLNQLKAKIDADTDAATLKTDIKTITESYRVYMLIVPQARIATAADREITLITMMNQLGAKLQARLSSAQSTGANVTALLTALTDMSKKLNDASTQAQAAVSVSSALAPDEGDKTKITQNAAALKTARADIQSAHKDLVAARKDAEVVTKGLKALPAVSATASSTTKVKTPATTSTTSH